MAKHIFCTNTALVKWEANAKPGTSIVYYEGMSLSRITEDNPKQQRPTEAVANLINRVRRLYNLGRITLTQKRVSSGRQSTFQYIATFRERPEHIHRDHQLPMVLPFAVERMAA